MKGMRKIKRGTSFRGVLDYVFSREAGKEPGRLLGGNVSGTDPASLAPEFGVTRNLRYEVTKPVWHNSLRLPAGDSLTEKQWVDIADDYMSRIGFTDAHMRCYVLHDDKEGQHIHIVASRIGLDSTLYTGQNENLESTRHISDLEKDHALTLTKGRDPSYTTPDRTTPKKPEIEKALRTNEAPARTILQQALDTATAAPTSAAAFVERLESAGVFVLPALASTGRLNGFSFSTDRTHWFKGSDLGKNYGLAGLQKKGVTYDKDRDRQTLIAAASRAIQAGDTVGSADTASNARNSPSDVDLKRALTGADQPARSEDGRSVTDASRSIEKEPRRDEQLDSRDTDSNGRPQTADKNLKQNPHPQSHDFDASSRLDGWRSVADDATSLAAFDTSSPMEDRPLTPAHKAKVKAVTRQLDALDAPAYRLTLIARDDTKKSFNVGKPKPHEIEKTERFYTKDEVIAKIPFLSNRNVTRYDIYVTPIDKKHHYILVDDMRMSAMFAMQSTGIKPCLIQETSDDNYQAVIKIPKEIITLGEDAEQSAANQLVENLNKSYGDPKLSGVVHPFRLAGFSNKKSDRKNALTRIVKAMAGICAVSVDMLAVIRNALKTNPVQPKPKKTHVEQSENMLHKTDVKNNINFEKIILNSEVNQKNHDIYQNLVKKANNYKDIDYSVIDFRFARALVAAGAPPREIAASLYALSPDLATRHKNNADAYISRTIERAEIAEREAKVTKVRDSQMAR